MKTEIDEELAYDVSLALPSWKEWYDFTRQYRECLKKKIVKGTYDRTKAIKGYERLVYAFCTRLPYFKQFYADVKLNLPTRLSIADHMEKQYLEEIGGIEE